MVGDVCELCRRAVVETLSLFMDLVVIREKSCIYCIVSSLGIAPSAGEALTLFLWHQDSRLIEGDELNSS